MVRNVNDVRTPLRTTAPPIKSVFRQAMECVHKYREAWFNTNLRQRSMARCTA